MRVRHKEWRNDFCESFFKAGGTAGIQAEVAEEDPAPERQFVFPGLFYSKRKYCIRLNEKAVCPIEQKP